VSRKKMKFFILIYFPYTLDIPCTIDYIRISAGQDKHIINGAGVVKIKIKKRVSKK